MSTIPDHIGFYRFIVKMSPTLYDKITVIIT